MRDRQAFNRQGFNRQAFNRQVFNRQVLPGDAGRLPVFAGRGVRPGRRPVEKQWLGKRLRPSCAWPAPCGGTTGPHPLRVPMQHGLTSLFASLPVQPASDRPVARVAARDGMASARADGNRAGEQEFRLPPEPHERAGSIDGSRSRRDEPRPSSERRRADDGREPAPRRDDPPSRSDPPRRADRARDGEPPRREDPPRARAEAGDRATSGARRCARFGESNRRGRRRCRSATGLPKSAVRYRRRRDRR